MFRPFGIVCGLQLDIPDFEGRSNHRRRVGCRISRGPGGNLKGTRIHSQNRWSVVT